MEGQRIKIFNGQIITPYRIIKNGTVILEDGIVTGISGSSVETCFEIKGPAKIALILMQ